MENTLENIGLKNVSIDFLNSEIKNLFVVQGDTRTRGLLVRVKDNKGNTIPLSDEYELRLYAKRSGEDKLLYSVAERVDDKYKVYLTSDMLSKTGTLKIQLALYKGDVSLIQSRQSSIPIYPSMTCQFELGQDNVIDIVQIQESIKELEKTLESLKSFDGLDSLADFKKSEEERKQAEEQRKQSEEQRVVEETTRSLNEQSRIENEKQRISDEEVRKSNEQARIEKDTTYDEKEQTRNSNEEARKLEEQKRTESENLRVSQEQERQERESTREENEKIRKISETVRDDNETKRKLEEDTRVQQETKRVEAEKLRVKAESDRAGKFAGWDKTMQGVIPTATSTTAGIVRIDVDGESTAASLKTLAETGNGLSRLLEESLAIKADNEHVHTTSDITGLQTVLDSKLEQKDISTLKTQVDTNTENITEIDEKLELKASKADLDNKADKSDLTLVKNTSEGNSKSILGLTNELDNKANKADVVTKTDLSKKSDVGHTHAISSITNLQTTLDNKVSK